MEGGKKKSQHKPTGCPKTFLEGWVEGKDRGPFLGFTLKKTKLRSGERTACLLYKVWIQKEVQVLHLKTQMLNRKEVVMDMLDKELIHVQQITPTGQ